MRVLYHTKLVVRADSVLDCSEPRVRVVQRDNTCNSSPQRLWKVLRVHDGGKGRQALQFFTSQPGCRHHEIPFTGVRASEKSKEGEGPPIGLGLRFHTREMFDHRRVGHCLKYSRSIVDAS